MKNLFYFIMPVMFIFLVSCDKEDAVPTDYIANISFLENSSVQDPQEIQVTIHKGTPCQYVSKTVKTISGKVFNYDFILKGQETPCITMVAEESVNVRFDPSNTGQYTLNFLINGEVFETRTITVTE